MKQNLKGTKRRLVINTLTGWMATGCRMAIGLVMVPFLLRHLGKDGYGLVGLMGVIVGFSAVADMGLRQALGRELSEKVANKDEAGFRMLSSTALALYLGIATVLIVAGWVLAPWFVEVFKVGDHLQHTAVWMLRLYGSITLLLSFITPVFTAGLQSFLRFDAMNMVQTFSGIASGILLFVCISFMPLPPIVIWAVVILSMLLLDLLILWFFYRKWCFGGVLGFCYLNGREMKPLFQLGGYMYVLQMVNTLSEKSNPLIVSYFFGTAGVAVYQLGEKLCVLLRPVVLTLSTQVHPLTTRFHVLDQQDKQRKILVLGTRYTLLFGLIFSAGIILFSEPFCRLWLFSTLGSDYLTVALVMKLWAVVNIFDYAGSMHWPVLLGMKKMPFTLAVQVPYAILCVSVSIYLVGFTDFGIPGVLVATILIDLVRRPIVTWYVARITGLSVFEYIRAAYLPPGILFALLLAFYFVAKNLIIQSWVGLASSAILFAFYTALVLMGIERRLLVDLWNKWRRR
jgi:O-antigen/teichoic acid export membrane protein